MTTLVQLYIEALGTHDTAALDGLYAEDVVLYTPFGWGVRGRDQVKFFIGAVHAPHPGLRVTLHDEFASGDGARMSFRFTIHWHNTGSFGGHEPTGEKGTASEIHTVRVVDGRIAEQWAGHNSLGLTLLQLRAWGMEPPAETMDPAPVIVAAGGRPAARPGSAASHHVEPA
ncbi:ester cyclase [Actinomadura roseirufa]|uniref:ester cyclase n=1 Tax=Actinomadura roseirufa TaxID=2094049 RepID=UPI001041B270|nr:nuclear transport factor 2 family protein [Actinomadura roseirufa]